MSASRKLWVGLALFVARLWIAPRQAPLPISSGLPNQG